MLKIDPGNPLIKWLLQGDVSIQFQTSRDLLNYSEPELKNIQVRIPSEGWGASFLSKRRADGHWGNDWYSPKWISTHYTLLDLKKLGIPRDHIPCRESLKLAFIRKRGKDGGLNHAKTVTFSDICINAMILEMAGWFRFPENDLEFIIDYLLKLRQPDGGWNCSYFTGSGKSSVHTTLTVLESFREYLSSGYGYRSAEVADAECRAREVLLSRRLFKVSSSDEVLDRKMLRFTYPWRWFYSIPRVLDYFQSAGSPYDNRMDDALELLIRKRRKDGTWPQQQLYAGKIHFTMDDAGSSGRWMTLIALRILKKFNLLDEQTLAIRS